MAELTYRDAVIEGLAQEMARDDDVVLVGEDLWPEGCSRPPRASTNALGPSACGTRRYRSRPSSAVPWGRR